MRRTPLAGHSVGSPLTLTFSVLVAWSFGERGSRTSSTVNAVESSPMSDSNSEVPVESGLRSSATLRRRSLSILFNRLPYELSKENRIVNTSKKPTSLSFEALSFLTMVATSARGGVNSQMLVIGRTSANASMAPKVESIEVEPTHGRFPVS